MKNHIKILLAAVTFAILNVGLYAQSPQSFSYQAVIRNAEGEPLSEQNVSVRLSIQNEEGNETYYSETHAAATSSQGVVTLSVGEGNNPIGYFSDIPWAKGQLFMKVEVDPTGAAEFVVLGVSPLHSVPYALFAPNTGNDGVTGSGEPGKVALWTGESSLSSLTALSFDSNLEVTSTEGASDEEPIFVVRNKDGQIVFAVYQTGVRVYVDSEDAKSGSKGGFAVGGLTQSKENEAEYFRVTPDSVRIYIDTASTVGKSGSKGGFAVGGLTQSKQYSGEEFFRVTRDSARINISTNGTKSGSKGGFAVGGLTQSKEETTNFMYLTPENYFIGHEAGASNTEGLYNSFLGYKAGFSNTIGNRNTFMGYYSGFSNSSGFSNIFIGDSAGYSNETGIYNVFIGNVTGRSNLSGNSNVFIGSTTGYFNETGYRNVFVGSWCGYKNTSGNDNIFMGYRSGWNNTEGYRNVFIGSESGHENITGRYNVFLGNQTGYSNTTGNGNVIIGATSGYNNTDGYYNVFLGNWCGASNTIGHENVFVGNRSGWYNTEGYKNIFVGSYSGFKNEIGSNNIFFGDSAGYTNIVADNNIFIGNKAGFANTDGSRNVFLGYQSGYSNQSGNNNVFLGNNSGFSNLSGYKNVFIGDSTGFSNNIGRYNIFIGDKVGYSNTEGVANVIIGATAGESNTTGRGNVFVGNWSGTHNVDGSQNVYLGNQAGWNNVSGWNNIFIGSYAGHNEYGSNKLYIENSEVDSTEALIWGDFAQNKVRINGMLGINKHPEYHSLEVYNGNGSSNLSVQGTGLGNNYSYSRLILMSDEEVDKRWDLTHTKENEFLISYNDGVDWHDDFKFLNNGNFHVASGSLMVNLPDEPTELVDVNGSGRFRAIQSGAFFNDLSITDNGTLTLSTSDKRLKENFHRIEGSLQKVLELNGYTFSWKSDSKSRTDIGLIAQEVREVFPEAVFQNPADGYLGINYSRFPALFVEAFKEQQKVIESQQVQIDELKKKNAEIEQLKIELEAIKALLTK